MWNVLEKIRELLPIDILLCFYNVLFLSFLPYGPFVWSRAIESQIGPWSDTQDWGLKGAWG